jgi:hypothetical protein
MKWAISIIRFQEELQQQKQSMQIMVRSGQVSEDMLNRYVSKQLEGQYADSLKV